MGYPMSYGRVLARNGPLFGDYTTSALEGDLRRLEHDIQDHHNVPRLAVLAGITEEQVRIVLADVFEGYPNRACWPEFPLDYCDSYLCRDASHKVGDATVTPTP